MKCLDKIAPLQKNGFPSGTNLAIHGHSPSELSTPPTTLLKAMLSMPSFLEFLVEVFKPHSKAN